MLTLKFDKDTGRMIGLDAAGYPLIPAVLKRRETVPVSITLYSAGVPAVFSGGTLSIGLKALGLYSGTIAANVSLTLSGTTYSGDLSLSTTTIATLFAGVGLPPTEPDFVSLAAEVTHSSGWTAEAITLRCDNDYIVGGETLPGDEVLTAADRVQTGLDRVQTGLDRVQTGLDRAQTGLDRDSASDSAATASTQAGLASGYKDDAEAAAAAAEALALVQVDIRAQSTPPDDTTVLWLDESEESPMSADVIAAAASADSAADSATTALAAVGNVMVLVSQDATGAVFSAGSNITVSDGVGTYPTAIITLV